MRQTKQRKKKNDHEEVKANLAKALKDQDRSDLSTDDERDSDRRKVVLIEQQRAIRLDDDGQDFGDEGLAKAEEADLNIEGLEERERKGHTGDFEQSERDLRSDLVRFDRCDGVCAQAGIAEARDPTPADSSSEEEKRENADAAAATDDAADDDEVTIEPCENVDLKERREREREMIGTTQTTETQKKVENEIANEDEYVTFDCLFGAKEIFVNGTEKQKQAAITQYVSDSFDRLVYGYKHSSKQLLQFGAPIERVSVGSGLAEDDFEELVGVGLVERTKEREEKKKAKEEQMIILKRMKDKEQRNLYNNNNDKNNNDLSLMKKKKNNASAQFLDDEDEDDLLDLDHEDDEDYEDDDEKEDQGFNNKNNNNNNNINFYGTPSFGKDLNALQSFQQQQQAHKRRHHHQQQQPSTHKKHKADNNNNIDAHQFDSELAQFPTTVGGGTPGGDWTDDISLWAALDHLDGSNNNNMNKSLMVGAAAAVAANNANINNNSHIKRRETQAAGAHDVANAATNLTLTANHIGLGGQQQSSGGYHTTIVHHHHYPPGENASNGENGFESLVRRLEQLEQKHHSTSGGDLHNNASLQNENVHHEEGNDTTPRKALEFRDTNGKHVARKTSDENNNNNNNDNNLERRLADLERLLHAAELENSTLKRALHFKSSAGVKTPGNKNDAGAKNHESNDGKKSGAATLSHSENTKGANNKKASSDYDDSHLRSADGKSDKTNEATFHTLDDDRTNEEHKIFTEEKHLFENIREIRENGVSPDSSILEAADDVLAQQQQHQKKKDIAQAHAKRSLDREL